MCYKRHGMQAVYRQLYFVVNQELLWAPLSAPQTMTSTDFFYMSPEISVIIRSISRPCLEEAIASAINQDISKLEIIVVDAVGRSHMPLPDFDPSASIRLISKKKALSRAQAANYGMEMSKGRLLIFLDDDDLFLNGHLANLRHALDNHPNAVAAHTGVSVVDESLNEIDVYNKPYDRSDAIAHNTLPIHAVLFRRDAAEECRFDEDLDVYEDWDFWLQLSRKGEFVHVDGVTAIYRAYLGSSGLSNLLNEEFERQGRARIYDKWRSVWTGLEWTIAMDRFIRERGEQQRHGTELETRLSGLTSALSEKDSQLTDLLNHISRLETDCQQFQQIISELNNDNTDLRNSRSKLQHSHLELGVTLALAQDKFILSNYKLFDLNTEKTRLNTRLQRLNRVFLELNNEKNRLVGERDILEQQRDHYQQMFKAVIASTSWRIAGPLRRAASALKPLRYPRAFFWKIIAVLFHALPFKESRKRRIQDDLYHTFPSFFTHLPSYQYRVNGISDGISSTTNTAPPPFPTIPLEEILPAISSQDTPLPGSLQVDIIIPVYDGIDTTERCLKSVLSATITVAHRIILIDDASPRAEIRKMLDALIDRPNVRIFHNRSNQGFTATVNRGIRLSKTNDVILLNSDTEVTDGWVDRLAQQAYASPEIGTVTPFSNNATICSYPNFPRGGLLPRNETLHSLDEAARSANSGRQTDIPTAVGFCMYIKRSCLRTTGLFDVRTFGRGYGEENDFCLRASQEGWRHVLAADVFVFHTGEASFGDDSDPRKGRALEILEKRYPDYLRQVAKHVENDPALAWRIAITALRLRNGNMPVILMITHGLGGGTEKQVQELSQTLVREGCHVLIARSIPDGSSLITLELKDPETAFHICLRTNNEALLADTLASFGVSQVHVHHTIHWSVDVQALIGRIGRPFITTVHDYYWLCPRVNFMGPSHDSYCGEPEPSGCLDCLKLSPRAETTDIIYWRLSHAWLFRDAAYVIYPSIDARRRAEQYYPETRGALVPHEAPTLFPEPESKAMEKHKTLKIAILGVVARHKGLESLISIASLAVAKGSPVHFFVIGYCLEPIPDRLAGILTETGPYFDDALPQLLGDTRPDIVWFPACWPETYSYTLTAALRAGIPIFAPDLGAFSERLSSQRFSWLYESASSPGYILAWLEAFRKKRVQGGYPERPYLTDHAIPSFNQYFDPQYWYTHNYIDTSRGRPPNHPFDLRTNEKPSLVVVPEMLESDPSPCGYIRLLLPLASSNSNFNIRFASSEAALYYRSSMFATQRLAFSDHKQAESLIRMIGNSGARLIYDIDDDLLALDEHHQESDIYGKSRNLVISFLAAADETWVSTTLLKERLSEVTSSILVIPNRLDLDLWRPLNTPPRQGGSVRILYMGTRTHRADWQKIEPALAHIYRLHGNTISIHIIGIDEPNRFPHWVSVHEPPDGIGAVYPAFVNWLRNLGEFDIGIAPLTSSPFNLAKSGIKFFDYTALGAVTLASNLPPYANVIDHENNGILVSGDSPLEWERALTSIIYDHEKRQRLWQRAAQDLKDHHALIRDDAQYLSAYSGDHRILP